MIVIVDRADVVRVARVDRGAAWQQRVCRRRAAIVGERRKLGREAAAANQIPISAVDQLLRAQPYQAVLDLSGTTNVGQGIATRVSAGDDRPFNHGRDIADRHDGARAWE